ncbi:CRAL/TRIO, N-terminal domain [Musa troglodytarum]|uniref:CRAL/TRIO, N-terminal domain n=1 Tax=Musa troglodytarum TaxID=320322 RepID=A0A9E7FNT9_9LILI|nr:CRAL/TRIO, N-terminal domain [Musa troglodytarum]
MTKQAAKDMYKHGQATNGTLNKVAASVRRPFVTERYPVADRLSNIGKDAGEGKLRSFARALVSFLVKMLSFLRILRSRQDRTLENVHPSDALDLTCNNNSTLETINENCITSYMERLQKLELIMNELSNKPAEIPQEKEHMILDSIDRIKCVEYDLHKTNKVLQAAVMKQTEIEATLEALKDSNIRHYDPNIESFAKTLGKSLLVLKQVFDEVIAASSSKAGYCVLKCKTIFDYKTRWKSFSGSFSALSFTMAGSLMGKRSETVLVDEDSLTT